MGNKLFTGHREIDIQNIMPSKGNQFKQLVRYLSVHMYMARDVTQNF